jgi:hypothetical protein
MISVGAVVTGRLKERAEIEVRRSVRSSSAARVARHIAALLCVLVVCGACLGSAAHALASFSFGSEGEGAGQFVLPEGVAVDAQSGAVIVVDRGNTRVESFAEDGGFKFAWGWGVADGITTAPQTCEAQCFSGLIGTGAGQFGLEPAGVAIDDSLGLSAGDVYVLDKGNHRVEKFSSSGAFLLMFGGEVNATAVAAHGSQAEQDLCTAASGDTCQAGAAVAGGGSFANLGNVGNNVVSIGVTGVVYVGENERVQMFSADGVFEGEVGLPGVGFVESLLVDATGDLYVMGSEVLGVHKYNPAGTEELGEPRDPTAASSSSNIALGPAEELFVYNMEQGHVFEYDAAGVQIASFVEHGGSRGMAYSQSAGALYVLHDTAVNAVTPPPPGPVVVAGSESVSELSPTTAALNATVNPEGGSETTYSFQYVDARSFEEEGGFASPHTQETPSQALSGALFEDQSASAPAGNLQPRAIYHFRVVVTNAAHETTEGPDQTFTTLPPVSIESESVAQITAKAATLGAELNPHGVATTYHFEYDTTPYVEGEGSHGTSTPTGSAGAGTTTVTRSAPVQGLLPATLYHYRVIAENNLGRTVGPDRGFTTEAASGATLPDGRAWELVSPPDKQGVPLEGISENGGPIQAAADGSALAYIAKGPIEAEPPSNRSFATNQLLAQRRAGGWFTQDIATPHETERGLTAGRLGEYALFSADLSLGAVEPEGATPLSSRATERTPYLRQPSGEYTPLVTAANVPPGIKFGGEEAEGGAKVEVFTGGVSFVTASPDLGHVILSAQQPLTEGFASSGQQSLYEWADGELTLVSVLPNGHAAAEEEEDAKAGQNDAQVRNAVSSDGSRVVFETDGREGRRLYMRDIARGETVQLDAPSGVKSGGTGQAIYQDASADGSRVFFTDAARLTAASTARNEKPDLYACDISVVAEHLSCALEDLTVDERSNESADVLGDVIGTDDAGELVYFVANGVLAEGAVHGTCAGGGAGAPASATCNLYALDTTSDTTRLVAVLSNHDAVDWEAGSGTNLSELTGRVSSDGHWFAFMSQRSLTDYDNRDAISGQPDEEVFLYHAQSPGHEPATLRCASCNPTGARPVGLLESVHPPFPLVDRAHLWEGQTLAAAIPGWTRITKDEALYQSRYLSDSGRLFFNSYDGLVPRDSNGTADVYQYEPPGVGDCAESSPTFAAASGGCVGLISSGASGQESAFLDASVSGDDVFILTASQLAPSDVDSALDVYDAHVCTTDSPCPTPPPPAPPACDGDACQNPAVAPNDPTPGSLTFHGAGNVVPPAVVKASTRPLTRAQKLAKALKACRKDRNRKKRVTCVKRVQQKYGVKKAHKSRSSRSGGSGRGK